MVENSNPEYTSNDIRSMALQIPPNEREGEYETLDEFALEGSEDALEYLFEEVLSDNSVDIDLDDALEAQYGPDRKYEDTSELID